MQWKKKRKDKIMCYALTRDKKKSFIGRATNPSNDPLQEIRGPTTKSKTKGTKQALQDCLLKTNEKEDQCELRVVPSWVTLLQMKMF